MNFGQAFGAYWKNYAKFDGRARRSEYWYAALAMGLIGVIVVMFSLSFDSNGYPSYGPLYWVWLLATFIPNLSLVSRRLHDMGKSFGYYFIALIPIVGAILLLVALATDSQPETNKYGDPVK
jgi:uncharacterized membrane protein YhaH (DUF805 family)